MKNLKQIWSCQISNAQKNNISILKVIKVRECDSLTNLFPSNPLPLLNHLEEIDVFECGSVEVLFNIDLECGHEMEGYNSRLRRIKVRGLRKLKELWRMRGGNNSNILIDGFKSVEIIEIHDCKGFTNVFTPSTTNFDLGALEYYNVYNVGEEEEEIDDDDGIEIKQVDDSIPHLAYPSYLLRTSPHLRSLVLRRDRRVGEVVFEMDIGPISSSSRQLPTVQPPSLLLLPYLEVLSLHRLEKLSHVWKCSNWNAFLINPQHQPQLHQLPFQNLTEIYLSYCHKIEYLFSPLMAKYLSNLKKVTIHSCRGIEEVISSRDDENEENTSISTSSHQNMTTFFPHLDTLELLDLSSLKHNIDGGNHSRSRRDKILPNTIHDETQSGQVIGACWSFCQYPKKIEICYCNALGSLIPWYAVGQLKKLQELEINDCKTMMEIFESESSTNNDVDEGSAHHGGADLGTTLTTKNITNVLVPQLSNLKTMSIIGCHLLPHIFTFSTLQSLKLLHTLKVKNCKAIQVIVKEENGTASKDVQVFPRLQTLELDDLPNLKGFFLGVNEFKWPSLDDVMISDCPQLKVFTSSQSKTQKLKYIRSSIGKHSLESCGLNFQTTFLTSSSDATISKGMSWSFHNLIEINRDWSGVRTIIPSYALLQLQKLEKIHLKHCSDVEEVFEVDPLEGINDSDGFNESQTAIVKIPNLTQVNLAYMHRLKYLWKSTQWMVLEFPNLTTVHINRCHKLEHVFTCSMVGSLVQLHHLSIISCGSIEVIVKEEDKKECDGKVNEIIIMLPRLKSLSLDDLPSLKGFCLGKEDFSLPSLDTLKIKDCRSITGFTKGYVSTPELKVIDTSFGKYIVKPDLNSFIKTKQEEGYKF